MYKIILVTLTASLVSGFHLDHQVKQLDRELRGLENDLLELARNRNGIEEKGQLSNIMNTAINAVGTPPLVIGEWIQTNIAHATQIYNDLLNEIIQVAPNAGIAPIGLKPPKPSPNNVQNLIKNFQKITTSFLRASKVAKDVLDDYTNESKA